VPNYNPDIIFKDEEGTGADRLMTKRCKEKLDTLAISVMNQWPGVRVRVTEAWDEENHHAKDSLHYEGRAVDLTTSDRDRSKYGLLASLAVESGFDWVYYESRSHVHASCKAESANPNKYSGCFTGDSLVSTESGLKKYMKDLSIGDKVQAINEDGETVYSEVLLFLDRHTTELRSFIHITTESGEELRLTSTHLLYVGSEECSELSCLAPTYAGKVEIGQVVYILGDEGVRGIVRVISVKSVVSSGVYAPLTTEGNLVVDGVLASCYAVIDSQRVAHAAFLPLRLWSNLQHNVRHLFRTLSVTGATPRTSSPMPLSGVHWYADFLYSLGSLLLPSHLAN